MFLLCLGKEVAVYCSVKLGDIIKSMDAYGHGDIDKALKDAFLHCDEMLLGPDVIRNMKQIAESDIKDDRWVVISVHSLLYKHMQTNTL